MALRRAVRVGDGWHGAMVPPAQVEPIVKRLRAERPDPAFVISMRTQWDPQLDDPNSILDEVEGYTAAGVDHVVAHPRQRDAENYLRSMEQLASLCRRAGVRLRS
mgnify:FL=1